jgi:PAS domain S-box-containing protein
MQERPHRSPVVLVLAYLAAGTAWVLLSEHAALALTSDPRQLTLVHTIQGLLFVAMTGCLLILLLRSLTTRASTEDTVLHEIAVSYEQMFHANPQPMWIYDALSLRFLDVNGAAIAQYGWSREEFLKMTLADLRPPEDIPAMEAQVRGPNAPGVTSSGPWRHRRKDGSELLARISAHGLQFGDRSARLCLVTDVTAQQALAAEREQMITELRHSREWLDAAINGGRIGLWARDMRSDMLTLGGRWADLLGTTPDDFNARFGEVATDSFAKLCHPDDLPGASERFRAFLRDQRQPYADEYRLRHADGHWVWVLSRGHVAERDADGRILRMVGSFADITDVKATQAAREQQHAAEQANAMKSQFLARVSHELRTPLNAVLGFSQLLRLDTVTPLQAQQLERVDHIERAGQHLLRLITDLMDLSKVEVGAMDMHSVPLDLQALADEALAMVAGDAAQRRMHIERAFEAGLPPALADPLRLKQSVLNLLSNAIKYGAPEGTVRVTLHRAEAGALQLAVWNSGSGLSDAQLARLYEPFNRLGRDAGAETGSGIGLAITRQLIESMGGRIEARSQQGAWAEFTLTLRSAPPPATG